MSRKKKAPPIDLASANVQAALGTLNQHPMFAPLLSRAQTLRHPQNLCPSDGWVLVTQNGVLHLHPTRRADAEEWVWMIAHALLHLGLGHFARGPGDRLWNTACCAVVHRFLHDLKLGRAPEGMPGRVELPGRIEEVLDRRLREDGIPLELCGLGTAGSDGCDMRAEPAPAWRDPVEWERVFGHGVALAVTSAVEVAAGVSKVLGTRPTERSAARRARDWFMSAYPLLGALAASFDIIEDAGLCQRMGISVAAVSPEAREIYIAPAAAMSPEELRFVMAHELLHVGLRHGARCAGRDPFLWNVACDYVINGWLIEMGVGTPPSFGMLHDPELDGLSAESIYDRVAGDLRRARKLATFRGVGACDVLGERGWWTRGAGIGLDELYRRCLADGLELHLGGGRGLLPAGLVEEIRALSQPPVPWDVELARWVDHHFPPLELRRTYARPSRRQSATPDIPRPRVARPSDLGEARTFAVVLDTSGSMDRVLLAKGLGAIASTCLSRDVPLVRLVFCDAAPHDQGFVEPEAIAGHVKVRGRGGTVLQPAIDLIEAADDFPKEGPILVITDGWCDPLRIARSHAFLSPGDARFPFVPKGPVFRID